MVQHHRYTPLRNPRIGVTLLIITVFIRAVVCNCFGQQMQNSYIREIVCDLNQPTSLLNKSFNECVGAGRANEGLRADWQHQLKMVKTALGFRYLRFHGLLSDDMGVYKETKDGKAVYNWQNIDVLFDFLLSIDVKPFVELSFMPNDLASGKQTIFWWRGNITPPKDYAKWNELIRQLLVHWTKRYGETQVASWYFEIWNEPNLKGMFFTGDQQDYFKLYQQTARTIKSVSSKYRVGGPASAGNAWVPAFLKYCTAGNAPIDFITAHEYSVRSGFVDTSGNTGTIINPNKNWVASVMRNTRDTINHSKRPDLELHYTEWSASYTPTDPIHDCYQEASFILNTIKRAGPYVNSLSYWTFTDIFEELGPPFQPFHGGFGLLNVQDIKKPAFYAFKFLNELGQNQYPCSDSSSFVCKDNKGNLQVLLWDCTIDHPGDSTNDQIYYKRDLPAKTISPAHLRLRHLMPGKYWLRVYQTGYHVNDAYGAYLSLGSPQHLSSAQLSFIKSRSDGSAVQSELVTIGANGVFEIQLAMRQNDVFFLTLKPLM